MVVTKIERIIKCIIFLYKMPIQSNYESTYKELKELEERNNDIVMRVIARLKPKEMQGLEEAISEIEINHLELHRLIERMYELGSTDGLTKLKTKGYFESTLREMLEEATTFIEEKPNRFVDTEHKAQWTIWMYRELYKEIYRNLNNGLFIIRSESEGTLICDDAIARVLEVDAKRYYIINGSREDAQRIGLSLGAASNTPVACVFVPLEERVILPIINYHMDLARKMAQLRGEAFRIFDPAEDTLYKYLMQLHAN